MNALKEACSSKLNHPTSMAAHRCSCSVLAAHVLNKAACFETRAASLMGSDRNAVIEALSNLITLQQTHSRIPYAPSS